MKDKNKRACRVEQKEFRQMTVTGCRVQMDYKKGKVIPFAVTPVSKDLKFFLKV